MPEKTLPATKIHLQDHFTIGTFIILLLKSGFRFVQIPSESAFLEIFFQKIHFPLNSPLQLFEHYAKVNEWSKMVSKGFFLDLMTFLTHINIRPNEFLKSIFLCTTIPPRRAKQGWPGCIVVFNYLMICTYTIRKMEATFRCILFQLILHCNNGLLHYSLHI